MALFPRSKKAADAFTSAKNVADSIEKISAVATAFGLGDPTGATLTIAGALTLSAKAVSAISSALAEMAKSPSTADSEDHRTTLILCVANVAYFKALDETLSVHINDIGHIHIARKAEIDLEGQLLNEDPASLLGGKCSLFELYESQLKDALQGSRLVWSNQVRLAKAVTERAEKNLTDLMCKGEEPYSTLNRRLHNEVLGSLPDKIADKVLERSVSQVNRDQDHTTAGLFGESSGPANVEVPQQALQGITEQLALIEKHLRSGAPLAISEASEVSAQLRVNKSMFEKGKILLENGKLSAASDLFEAVNADLLNVSTLEATNLRARALGNIGHCHHRRGREAEAVRFFRESHELAPTNIRLRVNVAVADFIEHKYTDAETKLRVLHAESPNESDVLELLAEVIARRGDHLGALSLLELEPRNNEHYLATLVSILIGVGRREDAERHSREAARLYKKSHGAQFSVFFSIAEPILNRNRGSHSLTRSDRDRLRSATAYLEVAIKIAELEEEQPRLATYLANLCAVHAAVGQYDKASAAGRRGRELNRNDLFLLKNLFVAEIMTDQWKAAADVADRILEIEPASESILRKMHALIGACEYDQALACYDSALTDISGLDCDPRLAALRVECLRRLPDLDAANALLEKSFSAFGRNAELLLQDATMRANGGQHDQANRLFAEAEATASEESRAVVRRSYGLYLYNRRRWSDAVERFVEGESGDSYSSAIAVEYMHCLFELKRMPKVVEIGTELIEHEQFQASVWELTAQAFAQLGHLKDSERLFRELVRHKPTEGNHLSLAGICYRRRGTDGAIKVLEAAQVAHPKSYYVHVNLSGLYFSRRNYRKAFDAAKRAIEIAPNRQEGHVAMVRILGAGDGLTLADDEKKILHESIARSKAVRKLQMRLDDAGEIDLSEIIALLKEQSDHAHQVMRMYRDKRLPLTFLSEVLNRPFIDVWLSITKSMVDRHYSNCGTHEEQSNEQKLASSATAIILDATALCCLRELGLLSKLPVLFPSIHVATATFERFAEELASLNSFAVSTTSMGYDEGRVQLIESGPDVHRLKISILEEIIAFIESPFVTLAGLDAASWDEWQSLEKPKLGAWIMHPILIAKAKGLALYCDEQGIKGIARQNHNVSGFSSQALLRALTENAIIDDLLHRRSVVKLVSMNYDFVSLSLDDVLCHLRDAGHVRSDLFGKVLRQLNASNYTDDKSAWILGGVIAHLWFDRSGNEDERTSWINSCLDSIQDSAQRESALLRAMLGASWQLISFPEAVTALLHFLRHSTKMKDDQRVLIECTMFELVKSMEELSRKNVDPAVNKRWKAMLAWFRYKKRFAL